MAISSVDVFLNDLAGANRRELAGVEVDEVTWTLNGPGGAKIGIDPLHPDAMAILLNEVELQIRLNGSLVNGHYVIPRNTSGTTSRLVFDCEGILSYFQYAYVATYDGSGTVAPNTPILSWTAQEQFNIAVQLIEWVQAQPNGDRRIETGGFTPSGVFRSRTFYADAYENVYDALQEFPKLYLGFDFDVRLYDDGRREFWPYHPTRGSFKPEHRLEFDQRGNRYVEGIEDWRQDGINQATEVYNTGGTVTDTPPDPDVTFWTLKVVGRYEDVTANGSPRFGRMTKIISSGQIIDLGWLSDRAQEEELLRGEPVTVGKLAVSEDLFGLIAPGDVLPVNVDYGRLTMKGNYRIMEMTWRRDKSNLLLDLQPA